MLTGEKEERTSDNKLVEERKGKMKKAISLGFYFFYSVFLSFGNGLWFLVYQGDPCFHKSAFAGSFNFSILTSLPTGTFYKGATFKTNLSQSSRLSEAQLFFPLLAH